MSELRSGAADPDFGDGFGNDFAGLAAIVTGGSGAIGLAAAELLKSRGARVAVLARRPGELPDGIVGIEADVTDDASVKTAVDAAAERFGRLDVVVSNVGISAYGDVATNSDQEWSQVLDVNVIGMVRIVRHALPHLRRSPAAAIVTTGSIVGWAGMAQRALYSTTKGAVHALTLAMAADYVREGIRVNCVSPGAVDTPWVNRQLSEAEDPEAARAEYLAFQPAGRLVTTAEVAGAIAYLASPLSGGTTGTVLAVDGGMYNLRLRPPTKERV
ncbi:short-chain dehydrogenase/reductase SDR [Catenulispora acidiphila DSM 44928]|uniref:Short-chain dehydrogenase/reductase SDR n=1 Tax=Catenulispora acidiphila (strain DSM 44928 / JCM 14897 / NBRC 102108 / NRRL B-24433 / ID139908) TaxID=479433 RepID=C7QK78_CATAD|nr:SDR family oxidoreductase [Catenulispora acidiphila]ACU75152.1 short-chain dehydrogenase/reductase SDR [Catenulispora acidiphila DSM 44928]